MDKNKLIILGNEFLKEIKRDIEGNKKLIEENDKVISLFSKNVIENNNEPNTIDDSGIKFYRIAKNALIEFNISLTSLIIDVEGLISSINKDNSLSSGNSLERLTKSYKLLSFVGKNKV